MVHSPGDGQRDQADDDGRDAAQTPRPPTPSSPLALQLADAAFLDDQPDLVHALREFNGSLPAPAQPVLQLADPLGLSFELCLGRIHYGGSLLRGLDRGTVESCGLGMRGS